MRRRYTELMTLIAFTILRSTALTVVLASAVAAQRPGIGTFGRGMPGKLVIDPGIEAPTIVNPVNLLIENRTALALTPSQFKSVIAIKRQLDSINAPLARRIDSVRRVFKPGPVFAEPTRQRRDSIAEARAFVRELAADIEDQIAEAREKAYELLTESQVAKAEQIEEKARRAAATPARGRG